MRTLFVVASCATAAGLVAGVLTSCARPPTEDMVVGDCVKMDGPPDRPEAMEASCGSPESNFKVVATVADTDECPSDVDSYYSMRASFSDQRSTICMDIDWVVGDCMSIDPDGARDPIRVDCADGSAPGRQRATQILTDVAGVDQCTSGLGYPYDERNFTVCVEDVS